MDKKEVDKLVSRLNKLSDNPTKNLNKMKELAHVLVTYYNWNDKRKNPTNDWKTTQDLWGVWHWSRRE